jgi:hypothetical protein
VVRVKDVPLDGILRAVRDWWRGYSFADLESVHRKMHENRRPGAVIPVTDGEMRALRDHPWPQREKRRAKLLRIITMVNRANR